MAYYGQKNYPQGLGNSVAITIAEAGCLLTAICNTLLKLNGTAPDPPTLNQWFEARGDFIYDTADHASDDLAADSITKYDPTIVNTSQGNGSLPPTDVSIVKFHYNSVQTGSPIDHYCAVESVAGGQLTIIDSWDGIIKGPGEYQSVYGVPVTFYTYTKNVPTPPPTPAAPPYTVIETYTSGKQVKTNKSPTTKWGMNYDNLTAMEAHPVATVAVNTVITVADKVQHVTGGQYYRQAGDPDGFNVADCDDYTPAPPAAPMPIPTSTTPYTVYTLMDGYTTGNRAANRLQPPDVPVAAGSYYIFNRYSSQDGKNTLLAVNVTKTPGASGAWINVEDNKEPSATPISDWSTGTVPAPTVPPAPPAPTNKIDWRTTYQPFRDMFGEIRSINYQFVIDYNVTELDKGKTVAKHASDTLSMGGLFTGADGKEYLRPEGAAQAFTWYGVPNDHTIIHPVHDYQLVESKEGYLLTEVKDISLNRVVTFGDVIYKERQKLVQLFENAWDIVARKKRK